MRCAKIPPFADTQRQITRRRVMRNTKRRNVRFFSDLWWLPEAGAA
jgi:hypothetical protein